MDLGVSTTKVAGGRQAAFAVALVAVVALPGCSTLATDLASCIGAGGEETTTDTFSAPELNSTDIKRIAVFPVGSGNSLIDRTASKQMNRQMVKFLRKRNPDVELVGANEVIEVVNDEGVRADYQAVLNTASGAAVPNQSAIANMGEALDVDAIVQVYPTGLSKFSNNDGGFFSSGGSGTVTIQTSLIGTNAGARKLLWEGTAETQVQSGCFGEEAPTVVELVKPGLEATGKSFPKL